MIAGAAFAAALLCAGVMGLAIQRGATCTVAAMDELLTQRRPTRLLALLEASLWVAGGLLLARHLGALGGLGGLPPAYALNTWTLAGAALLGTGAVVNRACVIGAIARLGSGEWAWAATPLGFYLGCLSVNRVFTPPAPMPLAEGSPLFSAPAWVAGLFVAWAAFRVLRWLLTGQRSVTQAWSPHAATIVIGLAFVTLLLLAGAWAYTDVLADLARGMAGSLAARVLLALALLAGALTGGALTGKLRRSAPAWRDVWRCLTGGLLMGWGSLLIPGGNDGLVLLGMPLLWPYAWASFVTMCAVVALGLGVTAARRG